MTNVQFDMTNVECDAIAAVCAKLGPGAVFDLCRDVDGGWWAYFRRTEHGDSRLSRMRWKAGGHTPNEALRNCLAKVEADLGSNACIHPRED